MSKYEIELVNFGDEYWAESEISMLTGLEFDEIRAVTWNIKRWPGRAFIKTLRALGFNCNDRFVKFDKKTEHPCMMRCRIPHDDNHWAGFIYYDGFIYHPHEGKISWAQWNEWCPNYKVTSMLQVWVDTNTVINEKTENKY